MYTLHGTLGRLARYDNVKAALVKLTDAAAEHKWKGVGRDTVTLKRDGITLMTVQYK